MARPSFKPTKAMRHQVSIAKASGMSDEKIALGLGISRVTLLKHFGLELDSGAAKRQIEWRALMHASAKKGNVAAQKALIAMADKADVDKEFDKKFGADAPEKLGKKEAAAMEAQTAEQGSGWESLLPQQRAN